MEKYQSSGFEKRYLVPYECFMVMLQQKNLKAAVIGYISSRNDMEYHLRGEQIRKTRVLKIRQRCCKSFIGVYEKLSRLPQGSIYWGVGGGKLPPPKKKSFTEKKSQLFQIKIFFDDDFKESVKVTNVQKCDFSQS